MVVIGWRNECGLRDGKVVVKGISWRLKDHYL